MRRSDRRCAAAFSVRGYALLTVLLLATLLATAGLGVALSQRLERDREREQALLYYGRQIERALLLYHESTPGVTDPALREWPRALGELLEDRRFVPPRRHLRQLWPDPVSGLAWVPITRGDRIVGVRSVSTRPTLKRANFPPELESFARARTHAQWRFSPLERPAAAAVPGTGAPTPASAPGSVPPAGGVQPVGGVPPGGAVPGDTAPGGRTPIPGGSPRLLRPEPARNLD